VSACAVGALAGATRDSVKSRHTAHHRYDDDRSHRRCPRGGRRLGAYGCRGSRQAFADEPQSDAAAAAAASSPRDRGLPEGRVSARAAVLLNTGLTADCTALSIDNVTGNLVQQRPTFGGNLIATIITPNHRPQMASVRPNVIKRTKYNYNPNPKVVALPLDTGVFDNNVQIIAQKIESSICTLNDAPIIVAGGRGLKNKENVQLVYELANLLNGSVGATRAAVEAGWFPHESQIGQTGITVSPKLYIACGISGQIQHIAGISAAEKIIAINDDKDAPIFEYANYALVGDVTETLTSIITVLNKYKSN